MTVTASTQTRRKNELHGLLIDPNHYVYPEGASVKARNLSTDKVRTFDSSVINDLVVEGRAVFHLDENDQASYAEGDRYDENILDQLVDLKLTGMSQAETDKITAQVIKHLKTKLKEISHR